MIIRPATLEDLNWIYELNKILFKEDVWKYESYKKSFYLNGYIFLVAEELKPCGFVVGRIIGEEAEIMKIGVKPEVQRKGIGFRLLNELIKIFKKKRVKKVFLEVRESNFSAIKLYKKVGFLEIGKRKNYYKNENALVMGLKLT